MTTQKSKPTARNKSAQRAEIPTANLIGVAVLLGGAVLIFWFFWRRRQNQQLQLQAGARRQRQLLTDQVKAAAVPSESISVNNPRTGEEILVSVR